MFNSLWITLALVALAQCRPQWGPHKIVPRSALNVSHQAQSDTSEDSAAQSFIKFMSNVVWNANKADVISSFIEDITDSDTNVTLVAWQRVYDEQTGEVVKVNAIELVIPPLPSSDNVRDILDRIDNSNNDEPIDFDEGIPVKDVEEMRQVLEPVKQSGIAGVVTVEQFDSDGFLDGTLVLDSDELMLITTPFFSFYNKTVATTDEKVADDFIANPPNRNILYGEPSILQYDSNGLIDPTRSHFNQFLLGMVLDYSNIPDSILVEAPQIITDIYWQNNDKDLVPKLLGQKFNKQFPNYKWRVAMNVDGNYVDRDVSITLGVDPLNFFEGTSDSYLVYGVKLEQK